MIVDELSIPCKVSDLSITTLSLKVHSAHSITSLAVAALMAACIVT